MSINNKKDGTARSKSLQLTLTVDSSWVTGYKYVYMREGNSSGSIRGMTQVSMPNVTANSTVFEVKSDDATQYRARFTIGDVTRYTDYSDVPYNAGYGAAGVKGTWSDNKFTFEKTKSSTTSSHVTINVRFYVDNGIYFIEARRTTAAGNTYSISGASITYQLGRSSNTIQIQNTSGTQLSNTATYTLTSHTKCIAGVARVQMTAGSYFHGVLYYLDGGVYKTITNEDSYWYYKKNTGSSGSYGLTTYYS
jgi:hypothetical protein